MIYNRNKNILFPLYLNHHKIKAIPYLPATYPTMSSLENLSKRNNALADVCTALDASPSKGTYISARTNTPWAIRACHLASLYSLALANLYSARKRYIRAYPISLHEKRVPDSFPFNSILNPELQPEYFMKLSGFDK